ncbi:MAG: threonine/serine exporter family protein [Clostridium sp.]|uniref:threonine/serine exporter family protein n=1 Tax=Clostridium sp. TaxID=1506 RepID=UPI00304D93F3
MMKQIILAFFGSIFPAILFNIDRKKLFWAGISGALGWGIYLIVFRYGESPIMASFLGAFAVGMYSEVMSRRLKTPNMQFSIPGIFPLVPGVMAYNTIINIVDQDYQLASSTSIMTIIIGGAIAFGIMLSSTTFKFFVRLHRGIKTK